MLRDIVGYKKRYQQLKKTLEKSDRKKIHEDLLLRFLCTIQREEGIGVKGKHLTKALIEIIDERNNDSMSKDMENIPQDQTSGSGSYDSAELPSIKSEKLDNINEKVSERGTKPTKSEKETSNLYKAYKNIKDEIEKSRNEKATGFEKNYDNKGFIEVDSLIKYTHKILMTGVMCESTSPGQFSINVREANFNGKIHRYPKFENEDVAEQAVQTLVDKVNEMIENVRQMEASEEQKAKLYFTCPCLFLFCFLTLHPFGDGNGRLARLLSSYNLLTFSPFLTPIYNVFSATRECDYVQALVDARIGLKEANPVTTKDEAINLIISIMHQKPSDLCSMLIESNWTVWRQLLIKFGDKDIKLSSWEEENQTFLDNSFEDSSPAN